MSYMRNTTGLATLIACLTPPLTAHATRVQLWVDQIIASKATDEPNVPPCGIFFDCNTNDETYFTLAGAINVNGAIKKIARPRISPPAPHDYWSMSPNSEWNNLLLWDGDIPDGAIANLAVVVAEQENGQLAAISSAVKSGAALVGTVVAVAVGQFELAGTLSQTALQEGGNAIEELVSSLTQTEKKDDVIGGASLWIENVAPGDLRTTWQAGPSASSPEGGGPEKDFTMNGANSDYWLKLRVKTPTTSAQIGSLTINGNNFTWLVPVLSSTD